MKVYKSNKGYFYKKNNNGYRIRLLDSELAKLSYKHVEKVLFFDDSIYELNKSYKYDKIDVYYVKSILYNNFDSYSKILSDETLFFVNKLNMKYKNNNLILKGISINTLNKLNDSIVNNKLDKIVFDWDHTLSLLEGWFSDTNFINLQYNIGDKVSSIKNYAEYILGGSDRIKTLQVLFDNSNI